MTRKAFELAKNPLGLRPRGKSLTTYVLRLKLLNKYFTEATALILSNMKNPTIIMLPVSSAGL